MWGKAVQVEHPAFFWWWVFPDISKKHTTIILKVQLDQKESLFLVHFRIWIEGNTVFQNVENHLSKNTVLHPRRLLSKQCYNLKTYNLSLVFIVLYRVQNFNVRFTSIMKWEATWMNWKIKYSQNGQHMFQNSVSRIWKNPWWYKQKRLWN